MTESLPNIVFSLGCYPVKRHLAWKHNEIDILYSVLCSTYALVTHHNILTMDQTNQYGSSDKPDRVLRFYFTT